MRGRRGRPGLLGVAARTAVVAGTASAVSGSMRAKQAGAAQQAADADAVAAQAAAATTTSHHRPRPLLRLPLRRRTTS